MNNTKNNYNICFVMIIEYVTWMFINVTIYWTSVSLWQECEQKRRIVNNVIVSNGSSLLEQKMCGSNHE